MIKREVDNVKVSLYRIINNYWLILILMLGSKYDFPTFEDLFKAEPKSPC